MLKNQFGSSRMDTVLKMLLIAFISLLAFSSGVYFGKQLSDSDYQLKALESDFSNSSTKTAQKKSGADRGASPEDAINEEEVAALSEKLVNNEKEEMAQAEASGKKVDETRKVASAGHDDHAAVGHGDHAASHGTAPAHGASAAKAAAAPPAVAAKGASVAPAAPTKAAPAKDAPKAAAPAHADPHAAAAPSGNAKPDLSAAHKAAVRVANNSAPAEPAKAGATESRVPTSLPKTVGASQDVEFTVQVASYPTAAAAKERAEELVKKGFPAFPVEANVNGKVWYRVSVGSFKTLKDANGYRAQLLKQANATSAIVQRIQR